MNKELRKFYLENENTLLYFYSDLKSEQRKYDLTLNQLLTHFVEKNTIDITAVLSVVKDMEYRIYRCRTQFCTNWLV